LVIGSDTQLDDFVIFAAPSKTGRQYKKMAHGSFYFKIRISLMFVSLRNQRRGESATFLQTDF